ncbi:STAS-like domain-containing protein [Anaerotardibacter muris]|uniref:STAS-like domain-containing protein n=1 Tax=Anaerotardibacter muris TaxID=2941505 RepID=UPI0020421B69|nr:STAS-like domain-containing protein [Anaerotardibacter muris]
MPEETAKDTNSPSARSFHVNVDVDTNKKAASRHLSKKLESARRSGLTKVKLRVKKGSSGCYPNVCVPLAGVIDYYRAVYGFDFTPAKSWSNSGMLAHAGVITPYELDKLSPPHSFLNKVWKFTQETQSQIVDGIMSSLRRSDKMGKDVLLGLELALNEVMDNTLVHSIPRGDSKEAAGFVMAQHHKHEGQIAVAVYDAGQGITASLREGGISISSASEGLEKALMRGVTSGGGAGNGLWMMENYVLTSSGSFTLMSDGALHSVRKADQGIIKPSFAKVGKFKSGTTLVDFQIDCKEDISLADALGYAHTDLWTENHLLDDETGSKILVASETRGCGSRAEGAFFANVVLNLCRSIPGTCVLDFSGISIISASFADQLVSDLVDSLSFLGFLRRIVLVGLSPACEVVMNESFRTRYYRDAK